MRNITLRMFWFSLKLGEQELPTHDPTPSGGWTMPSTGMPQAQGQALTIEQVMTAAPGDAGPRVVGDASPMLEGPAFHLTPVAVHLVGIHVCVLSSSSESSGSLHPAPALAQG